MRWARLCGFAPTPLLPAIVAPAAAAVGVVGVATEVGAGGTLEELDVVGLVVPVGVVPPAAAGVLLTAAGALLAVVKADTTVDCCPSEFLVALR